MHAAGEDGSPPTLAYGIIKSKNKGRVKMAQPLVGIIMGSDSDLLVMKQAAEVLEQFGVPYEMKVLSAHRTPFDTIEYARAAYERGLRVIIAGAGGAAHLPGVVAGVTTLPVIGVPIESKLQGLDSLLSIVQMPSGVPVATVAIGGARNAGLLAVQILATADERLHRKLLDYKQQLAEQSRAKNAKLQEG
jgi:5-(carboxyamino)imidazole ribonucleotide mutase